MLHGRRWPNAAAAAWMPLRDVMGMYCWGCQENMLHVVSSLAGGERAQYERGRHPW